MNAESEKIVVAVDLNMLSLVYKPDSSTPPKGYDTAEERKAMEILSQFTNPTICFLHPQEPLRGTRKEIVEFVKEDFLCFEKSLLLMFDKDFPAFIDSLKQKGEKQDDVDLLCFAAFADKRINRILTVDNKFINRIPSIHGSLKKNMKMLDWVLTRRPDFFDIKPCLPSEFLKELQAQILA